MNYITDPELITNDNQYFLWIKTISKKLKQNENTCSDSSFVVPLQVGDSLSGLHSETKFSFEKNDESGSGSLLKD